MAEGIKISEMEQVTTLEDGCCFPVVSNGENKKITFNDLKGLIENYDGVEIHRMGINESTKNWELKTAHTDYNENYFREKKINLGSNAKIINVCITQSELIKDMVTGAMCLNLKYETSTDKTYVTINTQIGIKVDNFSQAKDVTCKGYIEYVIF